MKRVIALFLLSVAFSCKPTHIGIENSDSYVSGIESGKIDINLRPDYSNFGDISGSTKIIRASIYYFLDHDPNHPQIRENTLAIRRSFVGVLSYLKGSMSKVLVRFNPMDAFVPYTPQIQEFLRDQGRFSTVGSYAEIYAEQKGSLGTTDSENITTTRWEYVVNLGQPEELAAKIGSDLAAKDLVIVNGHIMTESIANNLKHINDAYRQNNVDIYAPTGDKFVDSTYVKTASSFKEGLDRLTPAKLNKMRLFVFNSCNSELVENMIFNAASQAKSTGVSQNLFLITQRNRSHFGAFYFQVPQLLFALKQGSSWTRLVDSMSVSPENRRIGKVDIELIPVLRTLTLGI